MLMTIFKAYAILMLSCLLVEAPAIAQKSESIPTKIASEGETMYGRFFEAECGGMCPTLLLVPGWPGNPYDVLDMGAMLHKDGINVVVFNPRGLHESEGTASFFGTLEDIGAVFEWLHSAEVVERFGIDTSAIVIGGHSFGGGTAMAYAARDPRVRAVVSLAGTDHGVFIREYQRNASFAEMVSNMLRSTQAPEGPARFDQEAMLGELKENQNTFGLQENAAALSARSILLIGGWEDTNTTVDDYMLPLYRALRKAGAEHVTFLVYHDNHGFGQVRERMADDIRDWILRKDSPRTTTPEENKEIVRRVVVEGVNTGNLEIFREMLAPDYARHSQATTGMEEIRGIEAMMNFLQAHFTAFPDWHEEINLMIAEDDKVAYITTGTGTHTGPMGGTPPTGKSMEVVNYIVQRIENGKIAETWIGWDNLTVLLQLGLPPPSAGEGK